MNINPYSVFINDLEDTGNCLGFSINDTYPNWINSTNDSESKKFKVDRIDCFKILKPNWSMIDKGVAPNENY